VAAAFRASSGKLILKICVSGLLLSWLLLMAEPSKALSVLERTNLRVFLLAFSLYLAGQVLSAFKWKQLTDAVGFQTSFGRHLRYYFTGMFFNAFGLGTVGGDVARALYLAYEQRRRAAALNTVVVDRVSGLLVLLAVALASLLIIRSYELPTVVYWPPVLLLAALLVGWVVAPRILRLFPSDHWVRILYERDLIPYWGDRRLMVRVAGLSGIFHLSQVATLVLLAEAVGLEIPGTYFLVFGPLVNIFSSLPVSWNGLGVREAGYIYFLGHIGIGSEEAVVYGLLWLALVILGGVVGGVVYVLGRHGSPRLDSEPSRPKDYL
jgi:uncharacterized membrane protein YbhN (UPF0104 family)